MTPPGHTGLPVSTVGFGCMIASGAGVIARAHAGIGNPPQNAARSVLQRPGALPAGAQCTGARPRGMPVPDVPLMAAAARPARAQEWLS